MNEGGDKPRHYSNTGGCAPRPPKVVIANPDVSGCGNLMAANLPLKVRGTTGGYEANS